MVIVALEVYTWGHVDKLPEISIYYRVFLPKYENRKIRKTLQCRC
jgi:hypothetical protein